MRSSDIRDPHNMPSTHAAATRPVLLLFCLCAAAAQLAVVSAQQSSYPLPEVTVEERQFKVVYEWQTLSFAYRSNEERDNALYSGAYIPANNLISDVKAFARRLYVTVPRMLPGVPATLGWFIAPNDDGPTDPEIEPFPSWEMNAIGNCTALQFVQGIAIDTDGIMWVIDSGRIDTLAQGAIPYVNCRPKLLLLDLRRNGTVLQRYEFPEDVASRGLNYLNKIVIDDAHGGFAYITDNSGADPGIVVYSKRLNRSWKVRENNSMRAAQNARQFAVNGTQLNFAIHIDGIALGPYYNPETGTVSSATAPTFNAYNENYERNVYYCPLSSYRLYSLPATRLRDPEFARRATPREVMSTVTNHGVKSSQTDGMIMDNRGVLYFGLLREHAIAQWDSFKPFTPQNQEIIAKDDAFIQWTDGMSFDEEGHLYVVVNHLHNFVAGKMDPSNVNFRILRAKTGALGYVYTNGFGAKNTNRVDLLGPSVLTQELDNRLGPADGSNVAQSAFSGPEERIQRGQFFGAGSSADSVATTAVRLAGVMLACWTMLALV